MNKTRYCKWHCTEWVDTNKWLFESNCGEVREMSNREKLFKQIYNDAAMCPRCGKPITVGKLMD